MGIVFSVEIPDSRRGERTQIAAYSDSDDCEKHQKIPGNESSGTVRQALFAPGNFGTAPNSIIALSRRAKTPLCKDMHCTSARTCIAERQTLSGFSGDRFFSERLSWGDRHCSRTWRKDPGKMVALPGTGIAARRTVISVQPASGWGPSKEAPCKHGHWWSYLFKSRPECSLRYALHRSALSELQSCTGFLQGDFESPPCTDLEFRLAPVHLDFSG
jgi:hypothetical protein